LALWLWGQSLYSRYLDHHNLALITADFALAPLFVVSWVVMTIAMMLPTSSPLIALFDTLTRTRPHHVRLVTLLVGGYLAAWTLFGTLVYIGDWGLHQIIGHVHWLEENAWMLGALTSMLAGIYQFTPLKHLCLEKCRSPLSFITEHWHGGQAMNGERRSRSAYITACSAWAVAGR